METMCTSTLEKKNFQPKVTLNLFVLILAETEREKKQRKKKKAKQAANVPTKRIDELFKNQRK